MFEAKEMRVPVPSCRQLKEDTPSENRVVGLSRSSVACAWSFGSEPVELRQENGGMGTTTVSGVLYWLSNDPIGIAGGLNQYVFVGNNPVNYIDPEGNSALGSAALVSAAVVCVLNAPIPGVGRVTALTLAGTDITLVGWNYYRLHPLARSLVDQHEAVHSQQGFFWAIRHPVQREIDAYQVMYSSSQDLLDHWWDRTRLPFNGQAYNDVQSLCDSSKTYLQNHGGCPK